MDLIREQIERLEALDVPCTRREDFDAFWDDARRDVADRPLHATAARVDHPIASWDVRDATFEGLDGTPIRTWVILPPQAGDGPVPGMVCYHGASGSRGVPSQYAPWVALGVGIVAMDVRMQGGLTGSATGFSAGGGQLSWATLGLESPRSWYYYHITTDALRAFRLAEEMPELDASRLCVHGGSQGGALSLTVAGLVDRAALCLADVPSSCWLEKRLYDRAGGYGRVADYLRNHPDRLEQVCDTLSYFDNLNHCPRIACPTLVSLGLKDPICPPENVYAAVNKITAPKEVVPYPFGEHGGGGMVHAERKLAFFRSHLLDT
jgi:cephalosporin-C deacetylase